MKKLFQTDPFIEIVRASQLKIIGAYQFLEASEEHCRFIYENFSVYIKAKKVHIEVLKEEEFLLRVESLMVIEMKKRGDVE